MERAYLIQIDESPNPIRFWTGLETLTYGGHAWIGSGRVINVDPVTFTSGNPDRRTSITFSGVPASIRGKFLQDPGPLKVTIRWIFRTDRASAWAAAPVVFVGQLSRPTITEGGIVIELETLLGDVTRGRPIKWSHEDQVARYPGDLGFQYIRLLAQRGQTYRIMR